ncbi:3-phosphoshikimate 1-carboxyvinyltransferase [uncultured Clostridium sp.]|uniref:3-phosphoshikimate 1-carboxyvinyltransferase n=1 Tax=uncultured Clostridium sp. TaxID=59620 RepID=UPI0028E80717|nr:3-phosphoshikimate 1-carboxyvinyltransferase [uncultured Clostridium sp.]
MIDDILTLCGYKENVCGTYTLPGDKSIAHRSLIIGGLPKGEYKIFNFPNSKDCEATLSCMTKLGLKVKKIDDILYVESPGYLNFNKKVEELNCENSGTAVRLLSGVLAALNIEGRLTGDISLSKRPMDRITMPLTKMGANIVSNNGNLPLIFEKSKGLKGMEYNMPVASAQVKSCLLISGFLSPGITEVKEKLPTRDHTERLFKYIGADIDVVDDLIKIKNSFIKSKDITVPGDISSAAFLISLALLGKDNFIKIEKLLLNERRRKYLDILIKMGANINYMVEDMVNNEEIGTVEVKSSNLKGLIIKEEEVPHIIDEIPILSILAAFSQGETIIKSVEELKYKESNRIEAIISNLNSCGIEAYFNSGDLIIKGGNSYFNKDINIDSYNDHRIAMSFLSIAMRNHGRTKIKNWSCSEISFPNSIDYFKDFIRII